MIGQVVMVRLSLNLIPENVVEPEQSNDRQESLNCHCEGLLGTPVTVRFIWRGLGLGWAGFLRRVTVKQGLLGGKFNRLQDN